MTAKEVRSSVFWHKYFSAQYLADSKVLRNKHDHLPMRKRQGTQPSNEEAEDRESVRRFRLCFKRSSANLGSIRDHMTFITQSQG